MTCFGSMAFLEMGSGQILLILLLALLFFGAKRLPELARSLGLAKREFQKASREVSEELEKGDAAKPVDTKTTAPASEAKKT
ncbi:MAG: twin-arginine translocase TatA/TatE family subunit [Verrucomicrobiae bacterium]|nr:twin-arginine translocase TatA/TatE family subunit [Verrucomicrobiae bacterium]